MRSVFPHLKKALRGLRTGWGVLGVTLCILLVSEGAFRLARAIWRKSDRTALASASAFQDAPWSGRYVDDLLTQVTARWHPYVYWRNAPLESPFINIDESGLRRTIHPQSDRTEGASTSKGPLRVFMFGGSALWGYGARDEHTIPSELAQELARRGYDALVTNFGQLGYVSTQDRLALEEELRVGNIPDVAVFLNGYNDLMAALQTQQGGLPQNESNRRAEFNANTWQTLGRDLERSGIFWFIEGLSRRLGGNSDHRIESGQVATEELASEVSRFYTENLQCIDTLGQRHGFLPLYYWQPTVFTKRHRVGSEEPAFQEYPILADLLRDTLSHLQQVGKSESSPTLIDTAPLFDDAEEAVFIDACHFNEAACRTIAIQMANDIDKLFAPPSDELR